MQTETAPAQQDPYLDAKRFPLTTQGNLSLQDQKMIDAVNTDELRECRENNTPLNEREQAIARELDEKAKMLQASRTPADPAAA
jgi:hypothetical protein